MKVKELIKLLQNFDEEVNVAFDDRGIWRDLDEPRIASHMNGECILLQPGTWSGCGYTINYSKRYGYEMVPNEPIISACLQLNDPDWIKLRSAIRELDCEFEEECITMYGPFAKDDPLESIGPNCPRDFGTDVYAKAEEVMKIIIHELRNATPGTVSIDSLSYLDGLVPNREVL